MSKSLKKFKSSMKNHQNVANKWQYIKVYTLGK